METDADKRLTVSTITLGRSNDWVHHVIKMLEAAAHQVYSRDKTAHGTILQAASLLRQQIDPPSPEKIPNGGRRLLAWQAHKVRDYIDSHINTPMLVSDLGALVKRSQAHFSRSFTRTFGQTPHAFLVRRRVELAAQYMLTTDAPLCDIALRCGFSDQAHLCKRFRHAAGQTPAAWRRARRALHEEEHETPPVERLAVTSHSGTPPPARWAIDGVTSGPPARTATRDGLTGLTNPTGFAR